MPQPATPFVLKRLHPQFREVFSPATYRERVPDGALKYVETAERPVPLDALATVLKVGMEKFSSLPRQRRDETDAWFAPRIHASLRLYRREAADSGLWHYLTAVVFRDYVVWRWADAGGKVTEDRVLGPDRRNALAHLWWVAELGRNGSDYSPVIEACAVQEVLVSLTDILAPQNRAAAQAFLHFVANGPGGKRRTAKDVQRFRRVLNHCLSVYMLDAAAPDPGPDSDAIESWVQEKPDASLLSTDASVIGPNEEPVPEKAIAAIKTQLRSIERQFDEQMRFSGASSRSEDL